MDQTANEAAQKHRHLVDRHLAVALAGTDCFAELLPRIAGAGPADVLQGLNRMRRNDGVRAQLDALLLDAWGVKGRMPPVDQLATLPLPHPLDSEWRFSADS